MPKLPKIVNISKLSKTNMDFKMLHFTKTQWKKAIEGVKFSRNISQLPKKGLVLQGIPDPNGDVTVFQGCSEQSPDTTCQVRNRLNPDGSFSMQCRCRSRRTGGSGGNVTSGGSSGNLTLPACIIYYSYSGGFRCINGSCTKNCGLKGILFAKHYYLFCACA